MSEKPLDFISYSVLERYAQGISVADIAREQGWRSPQTVYRRMIEFPCQYEDSKRRRYEAFLSGKTAAECGLK